MSSNGSAYGCGYIELSKDEVILCLPLQFISKLFIVTSLLLSIAKTKKTFDMLMIKAKTTDGSSIFLPFIYSLVLRYMYLIRPVYTIFAITQLVLDIFYRKLVFY